MKNVNVIDWIAGILVIVGAVNWGLVGLFNLDLVALIFGEMSVLSRFIYSLVGLSGIWAAFATYRCCAIKTTV